MSLITLQNGTGVVYLNGLQQSKGSIEMRPVGSTGDDVIIVKSSNDGLVLGITPYQDFRLLPGNTAFASRAALLAWADANMYQVSSGGAFADLTGDPGDNPALVSYISAHAAAGALQTVKASDFISDDPTTDLSLASGVGAGIDQSAGMANIWTAFPSGKVKIIWDVRATGHLKIPGNDVIIEAAVRGYHGIKRPADYSGAVIKLENPILGLDGSNNPILPVVNQLGTALLGGQVHSNISILGMVIHAAGNSVPHLAGDDEPRSGISLWGVDGLVIRGCHVYDTGCYFMSIANCQNFIIEENICTNLESGVIGDGRGAIQMDGPNYNGAINRNIITNPGDDSIAFNANDGNTGPSAALGCPFPLPGNQIKMQAKYNRFNNCLQSFRILSTDMRSDDITIFGNKGTVRLIALFMDTFLTGTTGGNPRPGAGNIGTVRYLKNDIEVTSDLGLGALALRSNFERLEIDSVYRPNSVETHPYIWIGNGVSYGTISGKIEVKGNIDLSKDLIYDEGAGILIDTETILSRPNQTPISINTLRKYSGSLTAFKWTGFLDGVRSAVQIIDGASIESIFLSGEHKNAGGYGTVNLGTTGTPVVNLNTAGLISAARTSGTATGPTNIYPSSEPVWTFPNTGSVSWNPADKGSTMSLSSGNLVVTGGLGIVRATIYKTSGKWYWEILSNSGGSNVPGVAKSTAALEAYLGSDADGWGYYNSPGGPASFQGYKVNNGSFAAFGDLYGAGDVISLALDMTNGFLYFALNGVWQNGGVPTSGATGTGAAYGSLTGAIYPAVGFGQSGNNMTANFGGSSFTYAPPSGYLALT